MKVVFDKEMLVPGNLTSIDSRVMNIEVKGKKGIIERWNVTEFTKTSGMIILLSFKEPLMISLTV